MMRFVYKMSFLIMFFIGHNALIGMEKNLEQIAKYDRKIEAKQKQLKDLDTIKYFKITSDQKAVAELKKRRQDEIDGYIQERENLLSKISKL